MEACPYASPYEASTGRKVLDQNECVKKIKKKGRNCTKFSYPNIDSQEGMEG